MPAMTDPHEALKSLQAAFRNGGIPPRRGELDSEVYVHLDFPTGQQREPRFTYFLLQGGVVAASATFVFGEPVEGTPCFQIGYAVDEGHRNRGLAQKLVKAALAELRNGFGRSTMKEFFIEAVVGVENIASQRVAAKVFSAAPVEGNDSLSGAPALQYLRKIEC
ncbi:GNAT family N-acetyltransferase [Sinorhizobium meliloti]|uniref:GNAT family N-acetyltransferase n=1 Tax=Rhizobium meliloti TaxID=382 RepID=UPI0013E2DC5D|nr:GNAT family N-acetyltransferase [Sinorhizobium meliloti]